MPAIASITTVTAGMALSIPVTSRPCTTWGWTSKAGRPEYVHPTNQLRRQGMPERTTLAFTPEIRPQWDWSPDAIRHVGHLVVELITQHLTSLPERPVFKPFPPDLAQRFLS